MVAFNTILLSAMFGLTNAHFLLNYPTTIGFDDDAEGEAPCGGQTVSFSTVTNFYVGGDYIALTSTHPTANWAFRATLDQTATGNFTYLSPVVSQAALGNLCEPVTVPSTFAGSKGIVQIVQSATDGLLYQCAAVNFMAGSNPTLPTGCNNATGDNAAFTTDATLSASAIPAGSAPTNSPVPSPTTSAAPPPATSKSAAKMEAAVTGLFWAAAGGLLVSFGL